MAATRNVSHWRLAARDVIWPIVWTHPQLDEPHLRQLVSEHYPFGERAMYPYKVWLEEVRDAMHMQFHSGLGLPDGSLNWTEPRVLETDVRGEGHML